MPIMLAQPKIEAQRHLFAEAIGGRLGGKSSASFHDPNGHWEGGRREGPHYSFSYE